MMNVSLFAANIISADRYRKLKKYRYILYFTILVYSAAIIRPRSKLQVTESLVESMDINRSLYFIIFALLIAGTVALYIYSTQYMISGFVKILPSHIEISKKSIDIIYPFKEIENLVIERGSTFHYEYRKESYTINNDNWIKFTYQNKPVEIEFKMDSAAHNQQFEAMINKLTAAKINFEYLSI